uniref:Uncharacterized protein n=1 Tax=Ananas comosus var. bracteatus TaxID=296719 RepID=A0A6V7PYR6_ANACO|nr:unnamed protein product [Ananas comosus var. bracteatus]
MGRRCPLAVLSFCPVRRPVYLLPYSSPSPALLPVPSAIPSACSFSTARRTGGWRCSVGGVGGDFSSTARSRLYGPAWFPPTPTPREAWRSRALSRSLFCFTCLAINTERFRIPIFFAYFLPCGALACVVVEICFRDFLRIICQRFSLAAPVYGIPIGNGGLLSAYVEVEVPRGEIVMGQFVAGARFALLSMRQRRMPPVVLLRDYVLSLVLSLLRGKYKRLRRDCNLLKVYCSSLLAEKEELLSDRREFKDNLLKCLASVKQ